MKKLINKNTGEIGYLYANKNENYNILDENDKVLAVYMSLNAVGEEWEDYEEPKDFWYIDNECGVMCESTDPSLWDKKYAIEFMKQIGNYFETREEAELAVRKLKAWKRLKDKGLETEWATAIADTRKGKRMKSVIFYADDYEGFRQDLDLLFGGEE